MENAEKVSIDYVLSELERLKREIQRLEDLLVPIVKDELSGKELEEIEVEAREFNEEEWVDADELDALLEDGE
ncbi:hypothetical protein A3L09_07680 [Thermococcus profundus]|uniref:Uncharacterized protein n=1 Tax=Thermococcus profundus TaxID=49899 RepID=A0A2Z2M9D5_THEPR|nr:DUF5646 family protein [Thermococcus profundus]ASJ03140.1 hypothetical protein A3L09_07680 [Thermococcus profundus]